MQLKCFIQGEGGAIFSNSDTLKQKLFYHHNFGHDGPDAFQGIGINAKMSELQAAMGLAVLPHMNTIFEARKKIVEFYNKVLDNNAISRLKLRDHVSWNYSYYPIMFNNENSIIKSH